MSNARVPEQALIQIQEISACESEKIDQARHIFISYFTDLYKDIPPETLGISNITAYLQDVFKKTESALKKMVIRGFLASIDSKPAGFSACAPLEDATILLIRTIPIHLAYQYKEFEIRTTFLAYFHQQFPQTEQSVMMVRKANVVHSSLCLKAGFTKDNDLFKKSTYLQTTYNPEWYELYVCSKGAVFI